MGKEHDMPTDKQQNERAIDITACWNLDLDGAGGGYIASATNAASLGQWVRQQRKRLDLTQLKDQEYLARGLIHTIVSMPGEHLADLVKEPASTGAPRWDAFLQALVAWRCQTAEPKIQTPAWAKTIHLDEAWAPFGGSIRDDGWYTLSVLSTPAAFLHRGIVLDRNNLVEL